MPLGTNPGLSDPVRGGTGLIMLPEGVWRSVPHTGRCATGVGWFALSRFGQSVCDPVLKRVRPLLLGSGTPECICYGCRVPMG